MSDTTVKTMLEKVNSVLSAVDRIVSEMKDGDRTQVSKVAEAVTEETGVSANHVLALVTFYSHESNEVHVARGRFGGLIKGQKGVKVSKKEEPAVTEVSSESSDDEEDSE